MKTSIFVTTAAGPLFLVWRDLYFPHRELQSVLLFKSARLRLVTQSPLSAAATTPTMGDSVDDYTPEIEHIPEEVHVEPPKNAREFHAFYGFTPKFLYAMTIGLKEVRDDDEDDDESGDAPVLMDINKDPWKKMKRTDVKAMKPELLAEVYRRCKKGTEPKATFWTVVKLTERLMKNPILDLVDLAFVRGKVAELMQMHQAVVAEHQDLFAGRWVAPVPQLRLIMCLIEDDIKPKFLTRNQALTRQQLDGRNSDLRDPTVYELIAARWNSDTFDPVVPASDVHEDFLEATDCSHAMVDHMTPATATKVKDLISQMRSDLTRIIQRWEQSGQGDGGSLDEITTNDEIDGDDVAINREFGALAGRTALALENRAGFLKHLPPYLLILWEMADQHQILYSTLDRLDSAVGAANASSAPSVITNRSSPSPSLGRTLTDGEGEGLNDAIYHFAQVVEREQQANRAADQVNQQEIVHQQELNRVKDLLTSCTARLSHLEDQARQLNRDKYNTEGEYREYIIAKLANVNQKIEETKNSTD
jgi:hypothetical protein